MIDNTTIIATYSNPVAVHLFNNKVVIVARNGEVTEIKRGA